MDENTQSGLSPAEEAYFESGGNAPLEQQEKPQEPDNGAPAAIGDQPEPDSPARDEKGRFVQQVPHAVFHAEREERKRIQAERDELLSFKSAFLERQRWIQESQQQEQQPEPEPDPDHDIFAALKHERAQRVALEKRITEREQSEQRATEEQQFESKVWEYWQSSAQEYAQTQTDFGDAAKWLAELRDKQLTALGRVDARFSSKQARDAQIDTELKDIIVQAARQGISPAEMVYGLAKDYGYAGVTDTNKPLELPEKLKQVAAAQDASRTVAQAQGRSSGGELSLEQIMAMPRDEFTAWHAEPKNARYYDRLIGA